MIKFTKPLSDYSYILSFDLAKRLSGYTLYDIKKDKVILAGTIDTTKNKDEYIWSYFYNAVTDVISSLDNKSNVFIVKERLPNQNGRFSTIDTLQGLAQAHAVFDLAVVHSGIEVYDYEGIHATSVKAYFKNLTDCEKPQKEDIAEYLKQRFSDFDFSQYPFDVTDSLAVTLTLIDKKWNLDVAERIKELKKEQKSAKSENKIARLKDEIIRLESLKI